MQEQNRPIHPLDRIRSERTGVTDGLAHHKRVLLLQGMQMGVLDVVYDIIEAQCVKQETKGINLEPHQKEQVYAQFLLTKAFWQIFVGLQKDIQHEIREHLGQEAPPPVSAEQAAVNELLDPTLVTE